MLQTSFTGVADLYSLTHREVGPIATFTTYEDAERELVRVLADEPTWVPDLWIERFEVFTVDQADCS